MRTVAFFSYARHDDQATSGLLSRIRSKLELEIQAYAGDQELEVFQDVDDIKPGEEWEARLRDALDDSAFFLPVLTPSYFNRPSCRKEVETWLTNYTTDEERKRIIPIRFLPLTRLAGDGSPEDRLRVNLDRFQHVDFESHRGNSTLRGKLSAAISNLARHMASML